MIIFKVLGIILLVFIILISIAHYITSIWYLKYTRDKYARLKCEEQKKTCASNFILNDNKSIKYKTICLNTKNIVQL